MFGKKTRRVAALGAAGIGACALLAACSPVKVGSAAIVGDQRITVAALDSQVSNLQAAAKPYGNQVQLPESKMPALVLGWMIRFAIMDQTASNAGISVTKAQTQQALDQISASAAQSGTPGGLRAELANAGIPPQMEPQLGRFLAQELALVEQANGGKPVVSQAEANKASAALAKAQCTAAKTLNIQVSPQFGRFDYSQPAGQLPFSVVPADDVLSRPAGVPSPANTTGLTPSC